MNLFVLVLASIPIVLFCCCRFGKYGLSIAAMLLIIMCFLASGIAGAVLVQYFINGSLTGKRLYGLILADAFMLIAVSKLLKKRVQDIGDFVSVPIMAICCSTKIDCIVKDCCYGIVLWQKEMQNPVRFPCQMAEMVVWMALTIVLLVLERKERMQGKLWPFAMIWFGVFRFLADFFRGSELEKEAYLLGLTAGQFWSLVVLGVGIVFMYWAIKEQSGHNPGIKEVAQSAFGRM